MWTLFHGATIVLIAGAPAPTIILNLLTQYDCTRLYASPYVVNSLCKKKQNTMPSHTKVIVAGEPLSRQIRQKFFDLYQKNIIDNYGTKDELFQKVDELVISLEVTHSPAESLHTG